MKKFMMALGCVGLCTAGALAEKKLQTADVGTKVTPLRVAPVNADGSIGEWRNYVTTENPCPGPASFDFMQINWDSNADGICDELDPFDAFPTGGIACGLTGETNRWYFGTAYNNPFAGNDFRNAGVGEANSYTGAWWWGGTTTRNCFLIISVYDSNSIADDPGDCSGQPVQQTDTSFLGGVIFDFGPLGPGGGYYYFAAQDVCVGAGICYNMPADAKGAYLFLLGTYATDPSVDGVLDTQPGTQPMLWGINPQSVADQSTTQYDDDLVIDGTHLPGSECYTYSFGVCPDPLGSAAGIYLTKTGGCAEDCSGDGVRDQGDLALLLSCYNGGPCCDINGDGVTNQADLAALLSVYNTPCP